MWENSSYNGINVSRLTMVSWNLVCQNPVGTSIRYHSAAATGYQEDTQPKCLKFRTPKQSFLKDFLQKAQKQLFKSGIPDVNNSWTN